MDAHRRRGQDPLFDDEPEPDPGALDRRSLERSLAIGAKTLAGVCLGVLTVLVGVATAGVAFEAVLVPTLLLKVAGGVAGGSLGLAKGLGDERRLERGSPE